ncbi:MAG: hypothetical protein AB2603_20795, partial [Candidatus Thiodiazotropha endolucinida]
MRALTPLVLKRLLRSYGLNNKQLGDALLLIAGNTPSPATVSQILNRNIWPEKSPKRFLKKQINDFLRKHGVSDEEIATALDIDSNPDIPRSAKRGSAKVTTPFIDEDQLPET